MNTKKKLALIGCGLRGTHYLINLKSKKYESLWELAAVADPDPEKRKYAVENFGCAGTREFTTGLDLYAQCQDLDAVIVATPNDLHRENVIPAIERNLVILLEKPVANTSDDCQRIIESYHASKKPPLAVGFVLRYTPFYSKIHELLSQGTLGQIYGIEATEEIGGPLSALFMRGWRRLTRIAGPFIAEKCSHDIDILNWMAGAKVQTVSSFARRNHFVPDPEAAENCRDCKKIHTCRYSIEKLSGYSFNDRADVHPQLRFPNDMCVFNGERDIPDIQSVQLVYENGVIANFMVMMDQPRTTRTIRIFGETGILEGNIAEDKILIHRTFSDQNNSIRTEILPVPHDQTGHHGGDGQLADTLSKMLRGEPVEAGPGLEEGIEASLVCFCAEESRRTGRLIDISDYRAKS